MRVRAIEHSCRQEIERDSSWDLVLEMELATHQYGGGVDAGEADRSMLFRAASVKGQIREWWRYLMAHRSQYSSTEDLYRDETRIFGGIADKDRNVSKSLLMLRIYDIQHQIRSGKTEPPSYAIIAGDEIERKKQIQKLLRPEYTFKLAIKYGTEKKIPEDVQKAIRLWLTLGGVGARTSRGFGSLKLIRTSSDLGPYNPKISQEKEELEAMGITVALVSDKLYVDAVSAWNYSVKKLEEFRQVPDGREKKTKVPGKSYWPEADSVRTITGQHYFVKKGQRIKNNQPSNTDRLFFRAAFGLPIVFHFKGAGSEKTDEPQDTILTPKKAMRFKSPVILRTVCCDGDYHPVAYLIHDRLEILMKLDLELARSGSWRQTSALSTPVVIEKADWNNWRKSSQTKPLKGLPEGINNAALAFIRYFCDD